MKKFKKVAIIGVGLIEIRVTKDSLRRIVAFMLVAIVFTLIDGHSLSKVEASQLSIASDIYTSEPEISPTIPEMAVTSQESYSSLTPNPNSHLLSVGLNQDGEAVVCSIYEATGEDLVTYKLTKRIEDNDVVITDAEPLGISADSSAQVFWVSFDDLTIRRYDKFATFLGEQTVSYRPDGLELIGSELQYCSSSTNKVYRISSTGVEEDLGVVSRWLTLDGVAPDTGVTYTTQEYEGYSPRAISANYLCSAKISKRDISIGQNFIQTIPFGTPIWTNEQDTHGSCLGMTQVSDASVPEGHAIYLSSADGNIYKVRFVDKISEGIQPFRVTNVKLANPPDAGRTYVEEGNPWCGVSMIWSNSQQVKGTYRVYGKLVNPPASYLTRIGIRSLRTEG